MKIKRLSYGQLGVFFHVTKRMYNNNPFTVKEAAETFRHNTLKSLITLGLVEITGTLVIPRVSPPVNEGIRK